MAVGALIGAYQEDDSGGLRALLPLAGRTLVEYQVRCASAAGAAPLAVVGETLTPAAQAPPRSWSWSNAYPRRCRTRSNGSVSTGSACFRGATSMKGAAHLRAGHAS